ncbi:di-heme oxidoreductase family protein [Pedobacter arcticus]|uniref:di-heme oxidoreductase family protein n=1 Tax=Pedobacter arcticus TaxID=752140 RepID=UPI0002EDBA52|nr:di-heme oxidoredictase family protein [Pedobacter arcticus]
MKPFSNKSLVVFIIFAFIVVSIYLPACKKDSSADDLIQKNEALQGGENGTINMQNSNSFAQPIPSMLTADVLNFKVGRSFFHTSWVTAPASTNAVDGVGPLFNAISCNSCHIEDGRGRTPFSSDEQLSSVLIRLSIAGNDEHGGPKPVPDLGLQFRNRSTINAEPDGNVFVDYTDKVIAYADGTSVTLRVPKYRFENLRGGHPINFLFSPRIAPQVVGMGLLEAISESTILSFVDENDKNKDGISGRANYVWDYENNKTVLGRFGWKANEPSVRQQVAGALSGDMGITSPIFTKENLSGKQFDLYGGLATGSNAPGEVELPEPFFTHTVFYTEALAVPQRRNWTDATVKRGKQLFLDISCGKCHIPQIKTSNFAKLPLLSNQIIHPYTDLLLHDMGIDLADNRPDYLATGTEWRTPPLWGIGLANLVNKTQGLFLMHDGRARSIEEAILWHGGEADNSKKAFMKLSATDRDAVIKFVNDL